MGSVFSLGFARGRVRARVASGPWQPQLPPSAAKLYTVCMPEGMPYSSCSSRFANQPSCLHVDFDVSLGFHLQWPTPLEVSAVGHFGDGGNGCVCTCQSWRAVSMGACMWITRELHVCRAKWSRTACNKDLCGTGPSKAHLILDPRGIVRPHGVHTHTHTHRHMGTCCNTRGLTIFISIGHARIAVWLKHSADAATAGCQGFFQRASRCGSNHKIRRNACMHAVLHSLGRIRVLESDCMLVVPSLVASQQELHNEEKKKQINGLISYNDSTHLRGNPKPRPQAKDDPKPRPGGPGSRRRQPSTAWASGSLPRTSPHRVNIKKNIVGLGGAKLYMLNTVNKQVTAEALQSLPSECWMPYSAGSQDETSGFQYSLPLGCQASLSTSTA